MKLSGHRLGCIAQLARRNISERLVICGQASEWLVSKVLSFIFRECIITLFRSYLTSNLTLQDRETLFYRLTWFITQLDLKGHLMTLEQAACYNQLTLDTLPTHHSGTKTVF